MTVTTSPSRTRRTLLAVLAVATSLQAVGAASAQSEMAKRIGSPEAPATDVPDGFTVAAVGDAICHFPISAVIKAKTPKMIDIIKGADLAVVNFETTTIDFDKYKGEPQAEAGGSWLVTRPGVPQDLADMGFDLVGRANNHSTDWGVDGMKMTDEFLDKAGLVHAGTGKNLGAAAAPRYLEGRSFGRAAIVSFASSFEPMSPALNMLGEVPGRAGMNALHTTQIVQVSPEQLATLGEVATAATNRAPRTAGEVVMGETVFRATPGLTKPISTYTMNPADVLRISQNVRNGKLGANFEAVYMHAHQGGGNIAEPADFMPKIAHQAIDSGADAFFASGPHLVRGIEIYKGKPIFYSLGNFCHMDDPQQPQPQQLYDQLGVDANEVPLGDLMRYWVDTNFGRQELLESVIAVSKFVGGNVSEIRLYPIQLGRDGRKQLRGLPLLATPEQGKAVLERIGKLSEPFGTKIVIENNVGVIRVGATR